ncbi:MAG: hypothetical protein OEW44_04525 [Gemmatimonadota bacterium]|nr:hypothetical protein [Gemmatimonadota bacterium]
MEGLWILAIAWAVLSFLGKLSQQKRGEAPRDQLPEARTRGRARRPATTGQADPRGGDEPVEDEALEDEWRREIERLLGVRTGPEYGPVGRQSRTRLPEAEEVEERSSLELDREAVSLETLDDRSERQVKDFDEEAEAVLERRLAVAEARTSGRTLLDHRRFDEAIRAPVPVTPSVRRRPGLRQALVWREILGPPVSLKRAGLDD